MAYFSGGMKCAVIGAAMLLLSACGGGGGGNGSGGNGSPGGPSESRASREFPDVFSVTIAENPDTFVAFDTSPFNFYAPDNDVPTSLVLTGNDAGPFDVLLNIGAADGQGIRQITLSVRPKGILNFEDPKDTDGDNFYEFQISGVYKGETLRAKIEVTVLDVLDSAESDGKSLVGEAWKQPFGAFLTAIPDLTGDGTAELVAPISGETNGQTSAYVFTGEFLTGAPSDMSLVSGATDFGTRFQETGVDGSRQYNYLSALAKPDGTGTDLLLSEAAKDRLVLLSLANPADFEAIKGNINPDLLSEKIVYTFANGQNEGRLIGDVNGDGVNDIFVRPMETVATPQSMGIIFGETLTTNPSRTRSGTFDITLTTSKTSQFFNYGTLVKSWFSVQLLPDADGDLSPELVITDEYLWYVRGSSLQTAGTIDLDSPSAGHVSWPNDLDVYSVAVMPDVDGNGIYSLAIGLGDAIHLYDGSAFANLGFNAPRRRITRESISIGGLLADAGDLDGDGLSELIAANVNRTDPTIVNGRVLARTSDTVLAGTEDHLVIDLSAHVGIAQVALAVPLNLADDNKLVFGFAASNAQYEPNSPYTSGRIVIVDRDVVAEAVKSGAPDMIIRN